MALFGNKCKTCSEELTELNASYDGAYLRPNCKYCVYKSKKGKKYAPPTSKQIHSYNLKQRYGLTSEEYKQKLDIQLNGCAICKQPCKTGRNLAIDHDHKTNVLRDLLCQRCNVVLGLVNDDELLLFDMMNYLKRHQVEEAS
jgi:hypothetical protein